MTRATVLSKLILLTAGIIALLVGTAELLVPVQSEDFLGIVIDRDISLLNELRASGGGLAAVALLILAGAFLAELAYFSALLGTMLYWGYGLARVLSITLDGMPDPRLVQIAGLEFGVGLLCFGVFLKCRNRRS